MTNNIDELALDCIRDKLRGAASDCNIRLEQDQVRYITKAVLEAVESARTQPGDLDEHGLRECPMCKCRAHPPEPTDEGKFACCADPDCGMQSPEFNTVQDAVNWWNTRANSSRTQPIGTDRHKTGSELNLSHPSEDVVDRVCGAIAAIKLPTTENIVNAAQKRHIEQHKNYQKNCHFCDMDKAVLESLGVKHEE
jgi:hypothetical protein